jgi:hypothetical protein
LTYYSKLNNHNDYDTSKGYKEGVKQEEQQQAGCVQKGVVGASANAAANASSYPEQ